MCPVYHASWNYEDGVLTGHEEFDYRTPGVLSYYYSHANDQAGEVRSEIAYKTDENGWITQEGNCVYTYEFDEYGRMVIPAAYMWPPKFSSRSAHDSTAW